MKVLFWNVDTQKDFMNEDGKLNVPGAGSIKANLAMLTSLAAQLGLTVVSTGDWHNKDSKEIAVNFDMSKGTFPPHCMGLTDGADFIPETDPMDKSDRMKAPYICYWSDKEIFADKFDSARNIVIYKDAFDVFSGNALAEEIVKRLSPDMVVVYGVATNVCVNCAVLGLARRGYKVVVVEDAIKGLPGDVSPIYKGWSEAKVILTTTEYILKNVPRMV